LLQVVLQGVGSDVPSLFERDSVIAFKRLNDLIGPYAMLECRGRMRLFACFAGSEAGPVFGALKKFLQFLF
jgi:hypothetical protein